MKIQDTYLTELEWFKWLFELKMIPSDLNEISVGINQGKLFFYK